MLSNASSTSSLVTASAVSPLMRAAYRTAAASNHPQLRGRPVAAPNSPPILRSRSSSAGGHRRQRARPHAGGVGLDHAQHRVDPGRADPRPAQAPAVVVDEVTYGYVP